MAKHELSSRNTIWPCAFQETLGAKVHDDGIRMFVLNGARPMHCPPGYMLCSLFSFTITNSSSATQAQGIMVPFHARQYWFRAVETLGT